MGDELRRLLEEREVCEDVHGEEGASEKPHGPQRHCCESAVGYVHIE